MNIKTTVVEVLNNNVKCVIAMRRAKIACRWQQIGHFIKYDDERLTFRHLASCILGQAFHYSPENAFYIFNQQIYFII